MAQNQVAAQYRFGAPPVLILIYPSSQTRAPSFPHPKGPYPLGDLGKIGGIIGGTIGGKIGRRLPILLWVCLEIAGRSAGDQRAISVAGRLGTADLYQTYLIFHRRLVAGRLPSPGDQSATSRHGCQSSSGYGP